MTTYDGHVQPGGAPTHRIVRHADAAVRLTKLSVGPMDNNCYVLRDLDADRAVIVDAAAEPERVLDAVGSTPVEFVLTTHGHRDHWQALRAVAAATGALVVHHEADADRIPVAADRHAAHGDVLRFGDAALVVRHTPGHTPGSVCAVLTGRAADEPTVTAHVFTGDTLFPGGPGRTTSPPQFEQIMRSVRDELFVLPDTTWVCPGHGDDTTIGTERPHLDEWQRRGW